MKARRTNTVAAALAAACLLTAPATAATEAYPAPSIRTTQWLNTPPLSMEQLHGKVVLVEFWTFGCWNCRNVEPHIKAWHTRYGKQGLVVIGVHAPEFAYERDPGNLRAYLRKRQITWPVAIDNDFAIWHAWHNRAWPTLYLIDRQGLVQYRRIGEGGYERTEAVIRRLLAQ